MKIESVRVFRFSLPLLRPFHSSGTVITSREGFLCAIQGDNGVVGFGEVLPFPGFHNNTLESVQNEISRFRFSMLAQEIPDALEELSGGFDRWLAPLALSSIARYAVESAVLDLIAQSESQSLVSLMGHSDVRSVPVNALVPSDTESLRESILSLAEAGYKTFKLKISGKNLDRDCERIRMARSLAPDATLRLDANRSMDFETASRFAEMITDISIEYIEEPLTEAERLSEFARCHTHLPVALDESLIGTEPEQLAVWPGLRAIILKPSLHGVERSMRFIRRAHARGLVPVISSPLESGVGLSVSAALAAHAGSPPPAAGFDLYTWLGYDLLEPPFSFTNGQLAVDDMLVDAKRIRFSHLNEVSL